MPKTSPPEAAPQSEPSSENTQATQARPKGQRTPELEIAFGLRIRTARTSAGMSQTDLGVAIGVSFQQVQKYEKGTDRIAASTLQTIAVALGVHPGSFFDDVSMPIGNIPDIKAAMKAAEVIQQIRGPRVRRHLLTLAQTLAGRRPGAKTEPGTEHPLTTTDEPR
ncbi:MAG: helix-turn-helix domain-containing protein [Janthinobacterium lividum]